MSYSKIEAALKTVLPDDTYKVQAPDGPTRYLVWTPTGERHLYANGAPSITVHQAVVTVATQVEDDTLPAAVIAALAAAHVAMQPPEQSYVEDLQTYFTDVQCEVL